MAEKADRQNWLRLWWILLTLPIGFLGWAAFLYVGMRGKRMRWVAYGVLYAVPVVALFASLDKSDLEDYAIGATIIAWPVTFIHALVIRQEYLDRRELLDDPRLRQGRLAALRREFAGRLAHQDPDLALDTGLGRPELEGAFDAAGLVDVNHASARELARLPGVDRALAKQIALVRREIGGFESANELGHLLQLPAPVVDHLRRRAIFLPR